MSVLTEEAERVAGLLDRGEDTIEATGAAAQLLRSLSKSLLAQTEETERARKLLTSIHNIIHQVPSTEHP